MDRINRVGLWFAAIAAWVVAALVGAFGLWAWWQRRREDGAARDAELARANQTRETELAAELYGEIASKARADAIAAGSAGHDPGDLSAAADAISRAAEAPIDPATGSSTMRGDNGSM